MELEVTEDSALVLFDRIEEWLDAGPLTFDTATWWALAELLASLEERLQAPLRPDYADRIEQAARRLRQQHGEPATRNLVEIVEDATVEFLARDAELLEIECNERTITHRLAIYIERRLPGWAVDCEYNRKGDASKRLFRWDALLRENGLEPLSDPERQYVNPDIIVHHRGTDANLLVIEVKPPWGEDGARDLLKLEAMRGDLGYQYAAFLRLASSDFDLQWV